MSIRALAGGCALLFLLAGCGREETGPITVSAVGGPPRLANPSLGGLDPPSAFLLEAAAQGLVRFDAEGQIEPALAQSWIVSDDGTRYTFRIRRTEWIGGGRVTAYQVVPRLRAAMARSSRNPLKPLLGLIASIEPMTEEVLEFTLKAPRPHFLELLAQPEMAVLLEGRGTGPRRPAPGPDGTVLLSLPPSDDEDEPERAEPPIALRGERASFAAARFMAGGADLVLGGTAGDLPIVRAARPAAAALRFDPVAGLFGLAFQRAEGPFADPAVRRALAMAIDREGLLAALAVPGLSARASLLPPGLSEVPEPAQPDWAAMPLVVRREEAARILGAPAPATEATAAGEEPERPQAPRLRVAMPDGPGYRLIFAFLRRDWRLAGVEAERVADNAEADLRFVDMVAPASMAAWYLRSFTCDRSPACAPAADEALALARETQSIVERRALLAQADGLLRDAAIFVPIAAPVRWSLVSPRMTGFSRNQFGRHVPGELIAMEN
ncbi:MAG TPA: ABC transporter substrate-binding protein [Allosphingosinicella sp.]